MARSAIPASDKSAAETLETVPERRTGLADRRLAAFDRRNAERVAEDIAPRRNADVSDRRRQRR